MMAYCVDRRASSGACRCCATAAALDWPADGATATPGRPRVWSTASSSARPAGCERATPGREAGGSGGQLLAEQVDDRPQPRGGRADRGRDARLAVELVAAVGQH